MTVIVGTSKAGDKTGRLKYDKTFRRCLCFVTKITSTVNPLFFLSTFKILICNILGKLTELPGSHRIYISSEDGDYPLNITEESPKEKYKVVYRSIFWSDFLRKKKIKLVPGDWATFFKLIPTTPPFFVDNVSFLYLEQVK